MFIELKITDLKDEIKRRRNWNSVEEEHSKGEIQTLRRVVNAEALEDIALIKEWVEYGYKDIRPIYGVKLYGSARNDFGSSKFTEYYETQEEAEKRYNEIMTIVLKTNDTLPKEEPKPEVVEEAAPALEVKQEDKPKRCYTKVIEEDLKLPEKPVAKKRGRKKKTA